MGNINGFPNSSEVARVRESYPCGTRLELCADMQDPDPIFAGTRGTVKCVDGAGQICMKWDNGRSLSLIVDVDSFRKLTRRELIKEQMRALTRLPNCPNTFSKDEVFRLAVECSFSELADFMFCRTDIYGAFILTGELPAEIDTEDSL